MLALGVELIRIFDHRLEDVVLEWVLALHADPHHPWIAALVDRASGVEARLLHEMAWIAVAFGALHGAEGIGLWLRQKWSELMCLLSTAALLPLEIHELVVQPTIVHGLVPVINLAVLIYLGRRVLGRARPA